VDIINFFLNVSDFFKFLNSV